MPPSTTVQRAIAMMSEAKQSCVLIVADQRLLGIFTERDVVKGSANHSLIKTQPLAEVMTQKLITIEVSETNDFFALSRLLSIKKIRHLPVLDKQEQLVGIITPTSIRKLLRPEYLLRYVRAADVMARQVIHGLPDASVMALTKKMAHHRVSCIVIINHQTFVPIGILTERDIVRFQQMNLDLNQTFARDVMSQPLSTMQPQDSLWDVNQRMHELNVRRLVISHPTGKLAGVITQSQMTKMLDPAEMYHVMKQMQETIDRQTSELKQLNQQLQTANLELDQLSKVDELTQIVNRRKLNEFLDQEWSRLGILGKPLSLIMCDIDHFKSYNDLYGHIAGDKCLREIAQTLRKATRRTSDLVARFGGEEFAVVLPNADNNGAERVAKKIIAQIQQLEIPHSSSSANGCLTVSLGAATVIPNQSNSPEMLLQAADRLLYQSKQQGRNRYSLELLAVSPSVAS
ncbi:diguanylate cyclase [filamentous cyanobacterium LEGE 07170]|nr:diguanylate cyclase [filamentous cyanobacterium LEGE 07170]